MTEKARGNNLQSGGRQEIADLPIIEQTAQFLRIDWHHDRRVQSLYDEHSLSAARLKPYNTPYCDKKTRSRRCPLQNRRKRVPGRPISRAERPSSITPRATPRLVVYTTLAALSGIPCAIWAVFSFSSCVADFFEPNCIEFRDNKAWNIPRNQHRKICHRPFTECC